MARRLRVSALLAGVIAAAACATTHPENPDLDKFPPGVAGSTDIAYYDIHGRTARELVAQLRELGPKLPSGAFWAETQSMAGLETHEIGHKDIAGREAREILQRLNAVNTFCNGLSDEVKRMTDGIVARANAEQTAYDTQTHHGLTQGTAFPPRPALAAPPKTF